MCNFSLELLTLLQTKYCLSDQGFHCIELLHPARLLWVWLVNVIFHLEQNCLSGCLQIFGIHCAVSQRHNVNNKVTVLNHILLQSDAILSGRQVSTFWRNLVPSFLVSYRRSLPQSWWCRYNKSLKYFFLFFSLTMWLMARKDFSAWCQKLIHQYQTK
jgi:hypothetical protein